MAVALQPRSVGSLRLRSADPLASPRSILLSQTQAATTSESDDRPRAGAPDRLHACPQPADRRRTRACRHPLQTPQPRHRARAPRPVGTCRIGSDELAIVDQQLRIRVLDDLRIVDASTIPRIPHSHANLPTMIIAEKAADLIRGTTRTSRAIPEPSCHS